jgi:glycosyltransferase involved in cell wall biosynthesis
MRVLVVSQYFWPESFSVNSVVASLLERGLEVDVVTGKPNYPDGKVFNGYRAWGCQSESWNAAKIFRLPILPRGSKSPLKLMFNYLSFVISGFLLAPLMLRNRDYDVIFVYAPSPVLQAIPAIFLGWLKRCGVILWVQDLWPDSLSATGYVRSPLILGIVRHFVRWIYSHTDLLLLQSRAFEAPVAALAPGKPLAYYPNSVDGVFAVPSAHNVVLPVVPALDEGFSVVFAGNVGSGQAVDVIVEAAELLRDIKQIRFVVFGQGSRWEWMHEQIEARGLTNLHLPGRFPLETMPGLMQKAGALLVTLADQPAFALTVPNKVQAYMAVGRPILACLNGEAARLVTEAEAGLSIPAHDAVQLAAAVMKLYKMPTEVRAQLGINGRRYYEAHFHHEKLIDDLLAHMYATSKTREKFV